MAEPLVPEPSLGEVEIAIKSPGIDQIPAESIKAGGETLHSKVHKLILFKIRRNCHSSGRNLLLYQFKLRVIRLIVIIIEESPSFQLSTKFYTVFIWQG
jgi:hypothetical protein